MIDLPLLKTLVAIVPAAFGAVRHAPKAIRVLTRWGANRSRRKAAAISVEMKRFKHYQENQSALRSDTLRDLMAMGGLFFAAIMIFWIASSPSTTGWDHIATLGLVLEGAVAIGMGICLFDRVTTRLNQTREPHRTRLLQEIRLMRTRLDLAEARIRNAQTPILESETELLRIISAKLPSWRIISEAPLSPTSVVPERPFNHSPRRLSGSQSAARSSPHTSRILRGKRK
ncbi:hypothetical protein [Burkholderia cepacia]|uniref:hypothetical protein n=1 Tax=Burkholderia cepacia TaxID=292 RepID=UPI000F5FFE41|nr:hypothetical protein [Burkholderia cepacia]